MDGYTHGRMPPGGGEESASRMSEQPADLKVESVVVKPGPQGGFIVTCNKVGTQGPESRDYAFPTMDEAMGYVAQELGGGDAAAAAPPAPSRPPGESTAMIPPSPTNVTRAGGSLTHTGMSDTGPTRRG